MRRARWLARIDFADMCSRCIPHSVGKPDSRIIFVIVNQNVTKYLIVFQCEDCSLCSQCSNLIFTRSLWYSRFGGCGQNVRFSNGFRRIPLHRKISNVCIEDRVLSNEIWWFRMTMNVVLVLQSCCPPRCYRILGRMFKCLLCGSGPHQTQWDCRVSFPHRPIELFCYFVIWSIKISN